MRPGRAKWLHRGVAATWLSLAVPTLLWWSNSILWIQFMSLYANVASHWAAAEAAEAGERAEASTDARVRPRLVEHRTAASARLRRRRAAARSPCTSAGRGGATGTSRP